MPRPKATTTPVDEEQEPQSMWRTYQMHVTLLEDMLGTLPKDREVLDHYVRDLERRQDDEQVPETPAEVDVRSQTTFYVNDDGLPILMDYQVKGALKEAGNAIKGELGVANLRNHIEQSVFVSPRKMVLADKVGPALQRPLRAMTMQGPRVTVVSSDTIPAGSEYTWTVKVLRKSPVTKRVLESIGEYMALKGLGQWRNGGYGRCDVTFTEVESG